MEVHEDASGSLKESDRFNFPATLTLAGDEWKLIGRIHSTSSMGIHFFPIFGVNRLPQESIITMICKTEDEHNLQPLTQN